MPEDCNSQLRLQLMKKWWSVLNVVMKIGALLHRFVKRTTWTKSELLNEISEWGGREKKADCKLFLQIINSDVIIFWRLQERDSKTETWKHISNPINIYSLRQTWSPLDMSPTDCAVSCVHVTLYISHQSFLAFQWYRIGDNSNCVFLQALCDWEKNYFWCLYPLLFTLYIISAYTGLESFGGWYERMRKSAKLRANWDHVLTLDQLGLPI